MLVVLPGLRGRVKAGGMRNHPPTVVGIDPTSRGFGYAVFGLDGSYVAAQTAKARPNTTRVVVQRLELLLPRYASSILVVEDCRADRSRRGARVIQLTDELADFAARRRLRFARIAMTDAKRHFTGSTVGLKTELVDAVLRRFPDLEAKRPPPRSPSGSEPEPFAVFDALALAVTFLDQVYLPQQESLP